MLINPWGAGVEKYMTKNLNGNVGRRVKTKRAVTG
jgi:hypothetical protein